MKHHLLKPPVSDTPATDARSPEKPISRLLSTARDQGELDPVLGKRRWKRWTSGLALDATTDPAEESASWPVTMHNASGGGVAFWSRQRLAAHDRIYVREYGCEDPEGWLTARVTHCTRGIRGYLIGAAFEDPLPPDA